MANLILAISRDMVRTHPKHAGEYEPVLVLGYYRGMILEANRRIFANQRAAGREADENELNEMRRVTDYQVGQCTHDLENVGVSYKTAKSMARMMAGDNLSMMQAVEDCKMYCDSDPKFFRQEAVPI